MTTHCVLYKCVEEVNDCDSFTLATNLFNCLTAQDWRVKAEKQCKIRINSPDELLFMSVKYPCVNGRDPTTFMQAVVTCCPEDLSTSAATSRYNPLLYVKCFITVLNI